MCTTASFPRSGMPRITGGRSSLSCSRHVNLWACCRSPVALLRASTGAIRRVLFVCSVPARAWSAAWGEGKSVSQRGCKHHHQCLRSKHERVTRAGARHTRVALSPLVLERSVSGLSTDREDAAASGSVVVAGSVSETLGMFLGFGSEGDSALEGLLAAEGDCKMIAKYRRGDKWKQPLPINSYMVTVCVAYELGVLQLLLLLLRAGVIFYQSLE